MNAFFVTITLLPKMYKQDAEHQYDATVDPIQKILSLFFCEDYSLVAELTRNSNIHYHAIGRRKECFDSLRKKLNDKFRNDPLFGFINIKLVENEPQVLDYMKKSLKETADLIKRPSVIHDSPVYPHFREYDFPINCGF